MPFLVLAHVEPHHPVLAAEEGLRERAGQLRLADAGRAEEQEAADRPFGTGEPGPRAQYGVRHHVHRLVLSDDPPAQPLREPQQPFPFLLGEAADGDAGLPGDDLGDVLGTDLQALPVVGPPLVAPRVDPLPQLPDPVPQPGRLLVPLTGDRLVLVPGQLLDLPLQGPYVRALGPRPQPDPGAGLVHQVDGLVGQPSVGEIPVGQLHGGRQCLVGVADLVVGLVAVAQPPQDLQGVTAVRLRDQYRLEPAGQRRVTFDPPVLLQRRRPDDVQLAAREGRFEDVARVHRAALTGAGAHDRVQLVDEDDQFGGVRADLVDDGGEPLLEVAPVTGPGDHTGQIQGDHPAPGQHIGHVTVGDALGQPLHDRGLADTRLTDQYRVVLATPGEHLDGLLDLRLPSDDRVDTALEGEVGQVAAVLVEGRGGAAGAARKVGAGEPGQGDAHGRRRCRRGRRVRRQRAGRQVRRAEDVTGGRVRVGGEGAEDVFGAYVAGAGGPGQLVRVQQGTLDRRGERERRGGGPLAGFVPLGPRPLVDRTGQRVGVGTRAGHQTSGRFGAQRGTQQMLGVQVGAAVPRRVGRRVGHQLAGLAAHQPADLDPLRARAAEETGEELGEGVRTVALRPREFAVHSAPGSRVRRSLAPRGHGGA